MAEVFPILDVGQACFVATWRSNRRRCGSFFRGDFRWSYSHLQVAISKPLWEDAYGCFQIEIPQNGWLIIMKTYLNWMIRGYHDFLKHPYKLGGGFLNIFLCSSPNLGEENHPFWWLHIFHGLVKNHQRKHHSRAVFCAGLKCWKTFPKKNQRQMMMIHVSSLRIRGKSKPVKNTNLKIWDLNL